MAINPLIPLSGRSQDFAAPFRERRQRRQQDELLELTRREDARAQAQENRTEAQTATQTFRDREAARSQSVLQASFDVLRMRDPQQIAGYLAKRKSDLLQAQASGANVDVRETDEAMQAFRDGGVEAVHRLAEGVIGAASQAATLRNRITGTKPSALIQAYDIYTGQGGTLPFLDFTGNGKDFVSQLSQSQIGARFGTPTDVPGVGVVIPNRTEGTTTTISPESLVSEAEAQRAGAEATAETQARGMAERTLAIPEATARLASTESKLDRLAASAQSILDDEGLWQAVGLGRGLSLIPSGAGARVRAKIEALQSQVGLAVLQDIRDNSPTGGAVGQVSNFEQQLFQNNLAPLANLNVSPEDYRAAVQQIVDYANGAKERMRTAFFETYPEMNTGGQSRDQSQTAQSDPLGLR